MEIEIEREGLIHTGHVRSRSRSRSSGSPELGIKYIRSFRQLAKSVICASRFLRLQRDVGASKPEVHRIEDLSDEYIHKLKTVVRERNMELLTHELDGVEGIAQQLNSSLQKGIIGPASDQEIEKELIKRREIFGKNKICHRIGEEGTKFRTILWKVSRSDQSLYIILICFGIFFIVYDSVLQRNRSSTIFADSRLSPRGSPSPSPSPSPTGARRSYSDENDDAFSSHPSWKFGAGIVAVNIISILVRSTVEYIQLKEMGKLGREEEKHMHGRVVRCGRRDSVPREELVVGDLVELRSGEVVHVDGLLVNSHFLEVKDPPTRPASNGESRELAGGTSMAEAPANVSPTPPLFLWCNSSVQAGYGLMLVTAVGTDTSWSAQSTSHKSTPLQNLVESWSTFSNALRWAIALYFLDVALHYYGFQLIFNHKLGTGVLGVINNIASELYNALSLVGVLIPDDLLLAVTLTFAYSIPRLMADKVLVRNLEACETNLGYVTSVCIGKSGVLTLNTLAVHWSWIGGVECDELAASNTPQDDSSNGVLSQDLLSLLFEALVQIEDTNIADLCGFKELKQISDGASPVEQALLDWGLKKTSMQFEAERVKFTVLETRLFNSERKMSGVALSRTRDGKRIIHWKGAAETVLLNCSTWTSSESGGAKAIMPQQRLQIRKTIRKMRKKGLTCVALAYTDMAAALDPAALMPVINMQDIGYRLLDQHGTNLTLLAVVGMRGSCRADAQEAVKTVKAAGLKVRMVTGDSPVTATTIARECGILKAEEAAAAAAAANASDEDMECGVQQATESTASDDAEYGSVVDGSTFRAWSSSQMRAMLPRLTVLADATPSDKVMLVRALQDVMGEVVAVTGDKVEDMAAMEEARVGISLGNSSSVQAAKQSADIVILGDSFTAIVKLLPWGRSMRANVRHFLQFKLSITFATSLVVSSFTGVQLQWIDLIGKLAIPALIMERPLSLERQPPLSHPSEPLITFKMWRDVVFQAAYQTLLFQKLIPNLGANAEVTGTLLLNAFVFVQIFNLLNARQPHELNIFKGLNPLVVTTFTLMLALQFVASQLILRPFLSTTHMQWSYWFSCILWASESWTCAYFGKHFAPIPAMPTSPHHNSISINSPSI